MKSPLVMRETLEAAEANNDAYAKQIIELRHQIGAVNELRAKDLVGLQVANGTVAELLAKHDAEAIAYRKTIAELTTERAYNLRLRDEAVSKLEAVRAAANALEAKQRDIDDPPITREELGATLKRLSFHQVRADALEAEVAQLKEKLESARNPKPTQSLLKEKPCRSSAETAAKRSRPTSARKSQPASRRSKRSRSR